MNLILEHINSIGNGFVDFALPMLLQSSVLIAILLALDFILRKKVRAVFRYCVLMLIFVKLVLPVSLSSPISLAYLFGDELAGVKSANIITALNPVIEPTLQSVKPALPPPSAADAELVTVESAAVPASAELSWQGLVFVIWLVVVMAMLLLLIQRAVFVCGLVSQAKPANGLMTDALDFCRNKLGIKSEVGLRVSANATSPAVCGLFQPVILIPQNLGSTLGADGLRTVLLHELVHVKRGDLWVNLIQTLLQIFYFYNPLLWLANSIIRRIREQAVDEAVQVAMGEKAEQYPETLVNVAKLAFKRPALSLRLIGVVESRSALKGRVKRMLNRPIPKSAKLGILGFLTVLIFGAVLLPMAKAVSKEKKAEIPQFTAELANGVTVELVGICEHPSEGKQWWQPDGSMLEKAPYKKMNGGITAMFDRKALEAAIKIKGFNDGIGFRYEIVGVQNSASSWSGDQEVYCVAFDQAKKENETGISVGIASGKWETVMTQKSNFNGVYSCKDVIWHGPGEKDGKTVLHTAHSLIGKNTRVIAIDQSGKEHTGGSNSAIMEGLESVQTTFKMPLSQITEFQFQTRPYEWVTFKNVSLKPDFKTDVQIEIDSGQAVEKSEIESRKSEVVDSQPVVVRTMPALFADDVSPSLKSIKVMFDQPMMDLSWSWCGSGDTYPKTTGKPRYNQSKTTCSLPVGLEPGKVYWVGINSPSYKNFKTMAHIPATPYVILFATKDKYGKPTQIPQHMLAEAKAVNGQSEDIPYTQEIFDDIGADGTILFKTTLRELNRSGKKIRRQSLINSDFIEVESMSDAKGRPIKFTTTHEDNHYRYKLTFNEPVLPGEIMEYSHHGKMTGRITEVPGRKNQFRFHFKHWPAAGQPTRRIETYLLPEGAELLSTTPEDMQRSTKDGRIKLHIEKMIPTDGSITTAFEYRLPEVEEKSADEKSERSQIIEDEELNLTIAIPAGWQCYKNPAPGRYKFSWQLLPSKLKAWAMFIGSEFPQEGIPADTSVRQIAVGDVAALKGFFDAYNVRDDSWRECVISEIPTVSYVADYKDKDKPMVEYRSYLLSESMVYWFVFRIEKDKFESAKSEFDSIVKSFKLNHADKNKSFTKDVVPKEPIDSADLQNLIDSARIGSTVIVPNGIYAKPVEINKPLTLKGESKNDCVFEVTANRPAIFVDTKDKGKVVIEGITIKWQLATSDKNIKYPFALGVKDSKVKVKNCNFIPLGNFKRSPVAVKAVGFSNLTISGCRFEGFGFAAFYSEGTEGVVQDSLIANCKSQGITIFSGATVDIVGNIITGSSKHAVRNTGGTLRMHDNLIINNTNRGVYLGNKSARGTITNNIIMGNGTGISGFAKSKVKIENNIIANSGYAGIAMRDTCRLLIRNNIFTGNERGWILFKEDGKNGKGTNTVYRNTFWRNKVDAENFSKTANSISAEPGFVDQDNGDFSLKPGQALEHKQGLTNPQVFKTLWKKWKEATL